MSCCLTSLQEFASAAFEQAERVIETGASWCTSVETQVDTFLNSHLNPKIAFIAKNILFGLPVTLALLFLPPPIPSGLVTTYVIVSLLIGQSSHTISSAVGTYYIARAVMKLADFILIGNGVDGLGALLNAGLGLAWLPVPKDENAGQ
jgi:hypothetical protein